MLAPALEPLRVVVLRGLKQAFEEFAAFNWSGLISHPRSAEGAWSSSSPSCKENSNDRFNAEATRRRRNIEAGMAPPPSFAGLTPQVVPPDRSRPYSFPARLVPRSWTPRLPSGTSEATDARILLADGLHAPGRTRPFRGDELL